jgi:hypothetical protein
LRECEEAEARGVGVRLEGVELGPAAVGALGGDELLGEGVEFGLGFAGPGKAKELVSAFFGVEWFGAGEPFAGARDALIDLGLACGQRIFFEGVNGERGGAEITGLNRRAREVVVPLAVATLDDEEMMNHGVDLG